MKKYKSIIILTSFLIMLFMSTLLSSCTKTYRFIFYSNNDESIPSASVNESELEEYSLPIPTKEGYTFDGWYFDSEYTNIYSMGFLKENKNTLIELYGKYRINSYSLIVHETNDKEYTFKYNEKITLDEPEEIEGYKFNGYYLDNEYKNKYMLSNMPARNIELYPKYTINEYNITVHSDYDILYSFNYNEDIVIPDPVKDEYTFEGFYLDKELKEEFNLTTMPSYDIDLYPSWSLTPYEYTVTITSNIAGSVSFIGDEKQVITQDKAFDEVVIDSNYGYNFLYYEINGIRYASDTIKLDKVKSDTNINVVSEYATYEIPIININTNDEPILNKTDYVNMTFTLFNTTDELSNITGGIRLRGNSTLRYDKKPYRIKFDKKQSLFGLEKAKSWVLLAEYLDPSCLHNYTALSIGNELDNLSFTPTPNMVNLYLNGEYRGLYTLCEQVQEGKGRINIEKDITDDMVHLKDFNFFITMDANEADITPEEWADSFFQITYGTHIRIFELKYPEKDDFISDDQFYTFFNELKEYMADIINSFYTLDYDKIKDEVNISSLIDYFIVDAIMLERDHESKSFNMYYTSKGNENEKDKLSFGPIWDYDWSLDTPYTGIPNEYFIVSDRVIYSNVFFKAIENIPELQNELKERYKNDVSEKLSSFIDDIMIFASSITNSLKLNSNKWYDKGYKLTIDNIIFLNKHLLNRKKILDNLWLY